MARVLIGTSGWHYDSWRGPFFPPGLPIKSQLQYYASSVRRCRAKRCFLSYPDARGRQRLEGPDRQGFRLCLEGIQVHHALEAAVGEFGEQPRTARRSALVAWAQGGPVLFQLPPNFQADARSDWTRFSSAFSEEAVQFRVPASELVHGTNLRLLEGANISLCISDHHDAPAPLEDARPISSMSADTAPAAAIKAIIQRPARGLGKRMKSWNAQGCDAIFVFFDNDQKSAAPADALKLGQMLR